VVEFDLSSAPLIRMHVWQTADQQHDMIIVVAHAISDGWSWGVLHRDLAALYACIMDGVPPPAVSHTPDFRDFALREREKLASCAFAQRVGSLRHALAGIADLRLPRDFTPADRRGIGSQFRPQTQH